MENNLFNELLASVEQMDEIVRGSDLPVDGMEAVPEGVTVN